MASEFIDSQEHVTISARHLKIAAFISDVMKPAEKILGEAEYQNEAINDFESRHYQLEAWDAIWRAREGGSDRGLLHLATGLGKTSVAVFDYAHFRSSRLKKGESARGLFVVHQNNILDQASERFGEILPEITRTRNLKRINDPNVDMAFVSFQSLTRNIDSIPEDAFDYIIYDEAHHIEAKTYKKVVEHFKPAFQLGLTATPERMDEKDITDHFGKELYRKTLPEAIAEGHLAKVNYHIVSDAAVQDAIKNDFNPSTIAEIQRLFDIEPRNEVIVERIHETQAKMRADLGIDQVKTIIFCADMDHANEIAEMMGGRSYHSGIGDEQQASVLKAFKGSRLETITVRDMFNEGVDIPDARLIVFLRTTQSSIVFEQQLGRGLRKNKHKQEVTVLDFVANIERIAMIRHLVKDIDHAKKKALGENTDGSNNDGRKSKVKILSDESEFIFSQEIVDLLDKYNVLKEIYGSRERWIEWTDEAIADLARKISPDIALGAVRMSELSKEGTFPNHKTITERFGSIPNFQRYCGFEISNWSDYTRSDVIQLARELSPDKYMIIDDINAYAKMKKLPSNTFIAEMFGGLRQFQKEVWGREWTDWKQYSSEELVGLALELSPNVPLTTKTIDELSKNKLFPYQSIITEVFGSLREFQLECGFDLREDWSQYTIDEVTAKLKALSPDTPLTNPMVNRLSKEGLTPAASTIMSIYGSFASMQRACGFDSVERTNWSLFSDDELVLHAVTISPDKNLTSIQVTNLSKEGKFMSNSMLFKRFGSIKAFHELCDQKRSSHV